jgi:hypothetical protein
MVPSGPLLTNRMSELLTYGSVGGGGSDPAPYPALDGGITFQFHILYHWPAASDVIRYAAKESLWEPHYTLL